MHSLLDKVAIVGAGLGGCALALALGQRHVRVEIYESRSADEVSNLSGVLLTPNGLQVLEQLGILARIAPQCYICTHVPIKSENDVDVGVIPQANKDIHGFSNHRIWRKSLLHEMRAALAERQIPIHYNSRFTGILSENAHGAGVTFSINNSTQHSASLLIGSDGLHSPIRQYLHPGVMPEYAGIVGIATHVQRSAVKWPTDDYDSSGSIQGKPGALFYIAEDPDAAEIMIGRQLKVSVPAETARVELDALQADKARQMEMLCADYEKWGSTARSMLDAAALHGKDGCFTWPYMVVPPLPRWFSENGRIIIIGDAAHALPPSSGQGVNQALEDAYSLTLLLTQLKPNTEMKSALSFWQDLRQARINDIDNHVRKVIDRQRMPESERAALNAEPTSNKSAEDPMRWLYKPELEDAIATWLSEQQVTRASAS